MEIILQTDGILAYQINFNETAANDKNKLLEFEIKIRFEF